jgi:hypothetical protein
MVQGALIILAVLVVGWTVLWIANNKKRWEFFRRNPWTRR